MRHSHLAIAFLFAACGTANEVHDQTTVARSRPGRASLLDHADVLRSERLSTRQRGAWSWRSNAPAHASDAATSAAAAPGAPGAGGEDFYLAGSKRAEAPVAEMLEVAPGGAAAPDSAMARLSARAGALRAGSSDDNAGFDEFLAFLAAARADASLRTSFQDLDVAGRSALRVVDANGKPMPAVELQVVDEVGDKIVWRGTTYGDGRVPFYPAIARQDGGSGGPYVVEVKVGDRIVRHMWKGDADTEIRVPVARPESVLALDVVFVLDTTGSMGDEIDAIKATLLDVTARLRDLGREFDLRYGAVLYRDLGDDYVTAQHPFTNDLDAFDKALREVGAAGGGDGPESLNQGLAMAVDGMAWRAGAAKVAFLIADAPPHLDYEGDVLYGQSLRAAVARGIRVHTVAASGLDRAGSVVFRQIAQWTRGEFVFVEYGGDTAKSAAAHGVTRPATGNNLDEILFTRIRDEIAHWGS